MHSTDAVLLERWQRHGDADAFAEIVQRNAGIVHAACRRVLGDAALAEDVAQECFVELMRSQSRVRVSLGAWLHTLATRRSLDRIKGEVRRRNREDRFAATGSHAHESDAAAKEILALLDEAIEALPDKYRTVVVARFLEGESHASVAQRLNIAESTVRYRVNEAVARLRQHLSRKGVAVTLAGLTAVLASSAEAAPPAFAAKLCKMAVASGPPIAGGAILATGMASKIGLGLGLCLLLAGGLWHYQQRSDGGGGESDLASFEGVQPAPAVEATTSTEQVVPDDSPPASNSVEVAATTDATETTGEAFSIAGRVYDASTDAGIGGVRLMVFPEGGGGMVARSDATGANGRYRFEGIADGAYSVSLDAIPAYPDSRHKASAVVVIKDGQPVADIDFPMKKGVPVAGTVVDAHGGPVSGAEVGAKTTQVVNPMRATSGEDGHFTVYMPGPAGNMMVQAQSEQHESAPSGGLLLPLEGLGDIVLVLDQPRAAGVSGNVVDGEGKAVKGAQVRLHRKTDCVFPYAGESKADASGAFWITGCAAGEYGVIVTPEGTSGFSTSEEYLALTLAEGEQRTGIEIVFGEKGGLAIAGRVVDSQGKAVERASITCYTDTMERAYTEADGRFLITGLPDREGQVSLDVEHHDYSRARIAATPGSLDLEIVLKSRGNIAGRVLRADTGAPIRAFNVSQTYGRARNWGGFTPAWAKPVESDDGTLSLSNLNAGDISVAVFAKGFAPQWKVLVVEAGKATSTDFVLVPAAPFEGTVVDERGQPIAGAVVYYAEQAMTSQLEQLAAARTDEQGHYRIDSMPQDIPRLCAFAAGYGVGVAEPPGGGRIVLPADSDVEGAIVLDGINPSEININYYYEGQVHIPNGYVRPGADGNFQITGLTPGTVTVSVYPNRQAMGGVSRGVQHLVTMAAGATARLEVALPIGDAVLEGSLIGMGVPGGRTHLRLERRLGATTDFIRSTPDPDGHFRFENVWAGDLVLEIMRVPEGTPESPITEEVPVTVIDGEVRELHVELEALD